MGLSVASASFPCVLLVTFSYISYSPGTFVVGGGGLGTPHLSLPTIPIKPVRKFTTCLSPKFFERRDYILLLLNYKH